jgi:hypothetical protein
MYEVPGLEELRGLLEANLKELAYITVSLDESGQLGRLEWPTAVSGEGLAAHLRAATPVSSALSWIEDQLITDASQRGGDEITYRVRLARSGGKYLAQPNVHVIRVPDYVDPVADRLPEAPLSLEELRAQQLREQQQHYAQMLADQRLVYSEIGKAKDNLINLYAQAADRFGVQADTAQGRVQSLVTTVVDGQIARARAIADNEVARAKAESDRLIEAAKAERPDGLLEEALHLGSQLIAVHRGIDPDLAAALTSPEGLDALADPNLRALFSPENLKKLQDPNLKAALLAAVGAA